MLRILITSPRRNQIQLIHIHPREIPIFHATRLQLTFRQPKMKQLQTILSLPRDDQ